MKVTYDAEVDVLRILFSDALIEASDAKEPDMIIDYDKSGSLVGIEILDASKHVENPRSIEFTVIDT